MKQINSQVEQIFPYIRDMRREFHRHPELGFQEFKTAEIILKELSAYKGFQVQSGLAGTGITASIEGGSPGKIILLRFDMDALPVTEDTGVEYASQNAGLMHACGHDGHMAIGLGVARILAERAEELKGQVKILFQPAEEGLGGALKMIEAGVLENPRPDLVLGMHLWNEKPIGWLGISDGPVMSASETFMIEVVGRGGHGGMPHKSRDPITTSAAIIQSLQNLVSRETPPLDSAVISVASIHGGETHNVIPEKVQMEGTIRTFSPERRELLLSRFREVVEGIAAAHQCSARIEIIDVSPPVINDPRVAETIRNVAGKLVPNLEIDANYQTMASEDMAFIMQDFPACYFFVGSSNPELGLTAKHHQPDFNFDEESLKTGAALMLGAVFDTLR